MSSSEDVTVFEVGPRDGLQNEHEFIQTKTKVELINRLASAGIRQIEATSFVSSKWVPQMADAEVVMSTIKRKDEITYTALTPNLKGAERALAAGVRQWAVFASASEGFSKHNINCSITESIKRFAPVIELAKANTIPVRGYISCVVACPYDGRTAVNQVAIVAQELYKLGVYEISLGDTTGVATPNDISSVIKTVADEVPIQKLALHCHDTYGQAIGNIAKALELGIRVIDSSVGGLGGCPYAPGAAGNVATEDVLYLLNGMGLKTGINLSELVDTAWFISDFLRRAPNSRVAKALRKSKAH